MLKDPFPFDPGVLVEGNKVYLYFGFCPLDTHKEIPMLSNDKGSVVCELDSDMLTVKGELRCLIPSFKTAPGTTFEKHPFFEASSIRKIKEKYYFIYSSTLSHELCYAISDYPDRNFVFRGTIVSNGDIGYLDRIPEYRTAYTGNNHGSILCVNGQWYVFYHRHTEAIRCCRQACAEKIEILADGSIPQVEITSCGLYGGPMPARGNYNSGICCNLVSKNCACHIEGEKDMRAHYPYVTEDGEGYIANITDGTEIGYKYFSFVGTERSISVTIRGKGSGTIHILTDGGIKEWLSGTKGNVIGAIKVKLETEQWEKLDIPVRLTNGIHSLYFSYRGTGSIEFRELYFGA